MSEQKRLTRSKTNKVIAGVCGGLGEYFNIDPVIIRILFVAMVIWGGSGVLLYIILWLVIPEAGQESLPVEDRMKQAGQEMKTKAESLAQEVRADHPRKINSAALVGIILIVIGVSTLFQGLAPWKIVRWDVFWPVLIIVAGALIIFRRK